MFFATGLLIFDAVKNGLTRTFSRSISDNRRS